jgi:hypothetical protein
VDTEQMTRTFVGESQVTERIEIGLRRPDTEIPNGNLEFIDPTLLPGRITLSYDGYHFDIMERGYYVDGDYFDWQPIQSESDK